MDTVMGNGVNSRVGSAAKFGAGRYRQGRGVLEHREQKIRRFGEKAYIVSGPRAFGVVKDRLLPGLTEAGVEFVVEIYDGVCSYEAAEALGKKYLDAGCDEMADVGSGVIMDLSKAMAGKAGMGVISIPTSIATCATFTAMSVIYTPRGTMKDNWRYGYETDGIYVNLDVISGCPCRYAAAGILDAMARKIEILNGRPAMELDTTAFDLYTACKTPKSAYDLLEWYGHQVIGGTRWRTVTEAVEYVTYIDIAVMGIISNITRSFNQSALAHMIYYGIRTYFTREARQALHGEIVTVGLFVQFHYNGLGGEMENLEEFMRHLDAPLSLRELGAEVTETSLLILRQYLADSPCMKRTEKGLGMLHESIRKLSE